MGHTYRVEFLDLMESGSRAKLLGVLQGEPVNLCICDAQDMHVRHGGGGHCRPGFLADRQSSVAKPKVEGLGIWALLFRQLGIALGALTQGGCLVFRFSWVLSIYDKEVEACDVPYFEATMRLMHLLAELFDSVDVFKSAYYHVSDSTCYIICRGLNRVDCDEHRSVDAISSSLVNSSTQVLRCKSYPKLLQVPCLNLLSPPLESRVQHIRMLLEKVTAMREIGRAAKGLSSGKRFSHIEDTGHKVGLPIGRAQDGDVRAAVVTE